MTQAVAAIDPANNNTFAIWTQHTIQGGAGAFVRWYEINPTTRTIIQRADIKNNSLYYFNGAISPDRVVRGATRAFGQNMIINFNTSSQNAYPAIRMRALRAGDTASPIVLVKGSPGPIIEFSCVARGNNVCRWGDYAAATPDPMAPTAGPAGIVWGSSQWTADGRTIGTSGVAWRTWNWKSQN
jgi:hypothetical protein